MRSLFQRLLPANEIDDFAAWAFGEGYEEIYGSINFMHSWNSLHAEELLLRPDGDLVKDSRKMVELWKHRDVDM